MLVFAEVAGTEAGLLGSPVLLTAGGLAVRALPVATVLVCLYLLFAVVEAMHRDRATGFDALLDASPVSDTALLLGQGLAIAAVIAVLCAACVAAGLVLLLAQGGGRVETGHSYWFSVWFSGRPISSGRRSWSAVMVIVRSRTRRHRDRTRDSRRDRGALRHRRHDLGDQLAALGGAALDRHGDLSPEWRWPSPGTGRRRSAARSSSSSSPAPCWCAPSGTPRRRSTVCNRRGSCAGPCGSCRSCSCRC